MPTATGRAFTTANFLTNLAALKAINFGSGDPAGTWFVVPNSTTSNVEIWVWQPDSMVATDEISVVRPDSIVPGSPGRCVQRLKFDPAQLGGILAAIAALTTTGLIERIAGGGVSTAAVSSFIKTFLDDIDQSTARTTLGLGAAATRAIGTSAGTIRDAADAAYTNTRTPTAHVATHAVGGADALTIFGFLAVTVSSTLTAANQRQLINADATGGAITITLPAAATVGSGWAIQIRKADVSANLVTISRSGTDLINGVATLPLAVRHQSFIIFSLGGTSWGVVAGFDGTLPANSLIGRGATAGIPEVIPNTFVNLIGAQTIGGDKTFNTSLRVGESVGNIRLTPGTTLQSGYLEIYRGDSTTRIGYIGFDNNHITYVTAIGNHIFSGGILNVANSTQSTSTTTGGAIFAGGVGVLGNQYIGGFTSLGDNIAIKAKRVTAVTAAGQGQNISISPGVDVNKILGFQCLVNYDINSYIGPGHTYYSGFQFDTYIVGGNINILNSVSNSSFILSKPVSIILFYTN